MSHILPKEKKDAGTAEVLQISFLVHKTRVLDTKVDTKVLQNFEVPQLACLLSHSTLIFWGRKQQGTQKNSNQTNKQKTTPASANL